jgi:cellulose biosynthesis protein BcsQ
MKVITCFSYKGGAGRTTAAANIAAALASDKENVGSIKRPLKRKVALIDLDVFSAGTHRVFDISNEQLKNHKRFVQDYLREQISPADFIETGSIKLGNPDSERLQLDWGGEGNCHPEFILFPAKPDPDIRFAVQKQHENVLIELLMELEGNNQKFDYVVLDGESGTRSMADIAMRLSDIVLMFFRLTWQHIEGTLVCARSFPYKAKFFYLIPSCVPLIRPGDGIYQQNAPGLFELIGFTEDIPEASLLNEFAREHRDSVGRFWADDRPDGRLCIHDSLWLKGEERVIVFDVRARADHAARDFYNIAAEIDRLHPPKGSVSTGPNLAASEIGNQK